MPRHGVNPGRSHPRSDRDRRWDTSLGAPSLGFLWMALALVLLDSLILWTPAGAHPLRTQGLFTSFGQFQETFGWWNLTCPVCKGLFTAIDFGLQVSAEGTVGKQAKGEHRGLGSQRASLMGRVWHPQAITEFALLWGHPWLFATTTYIVTL